DGDECEWREMLTSTRVLRDSAHGFVLPDPGVATPPRIEIYPDGGISRLRLYGSPT
ncbi:allantoicase, partial [Streptomyces misionensis]